MKNVSDRGRHASLSDIMLSVTTEQDNYTNNSTVHRNANKQD